MQRIALTNPITGTASGTWFDADRATRYGDGRPNDATEHETLYYTASGRWILNAWSRWEGTPPTYTEIPEAAAFDWLIANDHAEVVDQINAGALAAREVGHGATPQRTIRIADDLWQAAQDRARAEGTDASELIRRLLTAYLA